MNGAGAVALALAESGVEIAFGLPGVHNLALWPACAAAGVRIVGSRHEQGCAYAADGLARSTGRLGVALTTTGPGAANTLGAVGEAWASKSPILVIATDIPSTQRRPGVYRGVLHECSDQAAMFAPVTKARFVVEDASRIGDVVHEAILTARRPPTGPVYVGIPTDLLTEPSRPARMERSPWITAHADLALALDLIAASERPLLWVGGGGRDAADGVDRLARRLGAPEVTTFSVRGVLPSGHPLLVPAPPHEPAVTALIERSDLAIVIGSDLDHMNTMAWRLPLPPRRIAVNVDAADATKGYAMDVVIESLAEVALPALAHAVAAREPWAGDISAIGRGLRDELRAAPETADAIELLDSTEAALPVDAVVFADMCIPGYWLAGYASVGQQRGLHYPMGWGTLGWSFPAAIGAAVALRGTRPVVAFCGDGGMMFATGELATVAQERVPLTIVVFDDGGYGMLRYGREGDPNTGCDLVGPDFVALAAAFGIAGRRVEGVGADFRAALSDAVVSPEPRLLHVIARLHPPRTTTPRWPLKG